MNKRLFKRFGAWNWLVGLACLLAAASVVGGMSGCAQVKLAIKRHQAKARVKALLAAENLAAQVTTTNLIRQVADLDRLARPPRPSYRSAWIDGAAPLEVKLVGNRTEYLLADLPGPGVVTHLWMADPQAAGEIRFYLDTSTGASATVRPVEAATTPPTGALVFPAMNVFGGQSETFPAPLSGPAPGGWACRMPIPFAGRCRITTSSPPGHYAIQARRYAPGTPVETFHLPFDRDALKQLEAVRVALAACTPISATPGGQPWRQSFRDWIAPNGQSVTRSVLGTGKLTRLTCRVAAGDAAEALAGCLVEIRFDGEPEAATRAPLGDLFGAFGPGPGAGTRLSVGKSWRALQGGVEPDGTLVLRWPMPFRRQIDVRFTNHTRRMIVLDGEMAGVSEPWREGTWQFRGWWRGDGRLRARPALAWPILGDGFQSGRMTGLSVSVGSPLPAWWGDGTLTLRQGGPDGKDFVTTPSLAAWMGLDASARRGSAKPDDAASTPTTDFSGWWTARRACMADDWPASRGLGLTWRIDPRGDCLMNVRTMAYGYAPPGQAFAPPVAADALSSRALTLDAPTTRSLRGAIECEAMTRRVMGGRVDVERSTRLGWSGGAQARWTGARPGDQVTFEFPVAAPGRYAVYLCATREPGAGRVSVRIIDAPSPARAAASAPLQAAIDDALTSSVLFASRSARALKSLLAPSLLLDAPVPSAAPTLATRPTSATLQVKVSVGAIPPPPVMLDLESPVERLAMPVLVGVTRLETGTGRLVVRREGKPGSGGPGVGLDYVALVRRRVVLDR